MREQAGLRLALLVLALSAGSAIAQDDERTAILAVMQQAFDAVHSQNPDDWRAIQLAEGTTLSFRPHPDGRPDQLEMRIAQNKAFVAAQVRDSHEYVERWTGDPTVMIRGPIAVVWGEYEFWIDGEFSHCGVDSVDFVKTDGTWRIANFMWTVEKDRCPTDPSALSDTSPR
jgi:hypothetical protein